MDTTIQIIVEDIETFDMTPYRELGSFCTVNFYQKTEEAVILTHATNFLEVTTEFVGYGFEGDLILGEVISEMEDMLRRDSSIGGVYTEWAIERGGERVEGMGFDYGRDWNLRDSLNIIQYVHPLMIFRQSLISGYIPELLENPEGAEDVLKGLIGMQRGWKKLKKLGYVARDVSKFSRSSFKETSDFLMDTAKSCPRCRDKLQLTKEVL